jgi:multisubunit Na+/H+ antiporter MnhE subunit
MLEYLLQFMKMVFSAYFVSLTVLCGLILSFIYPYLINKEESEFKKEYKIGKIVGYVYISVSIGAFFIVKLFG